MFEHYFTGHRGTSIKKEIDIFVGGMDLHLITYKGLFSYKELDKGTKLLIESMILPEKGNILDLGCGNGVVGVVAGLLNPGLKIYFTDINPSAISATKQNAKRYLDRDRFVVKRTDGIDSLDTKFNAVYTNPPFSAGKSVVDKFIQQSHDQLLDRGWLDTVVRKAKGGKSLYSRMEGIFGNIEVIGRGSGYQVYHSVKE